jgi:hypothetical protein
MRNKNRIDGIIKELKAACLEEDFQYNVSFSCGVSCSGVLKLVGGECNFIEAKESQRSWSGVRIDITFADSDRGDEDKSLGGSIRGLLGDMFNADDL